MQNVYNLCNVQDYFYMQNLLEAIQILDIAKVKNLPLFRGFSVFFGYKQFSIDFVKQFSK